MKKIRIGISKCLLGERVRYDGNHKLDTFITINLSPFFEFVPVCPEFDCGLGVPREAMHLVQTKDGIKLKTINSKKDITPQMLDWIKLKLVELEKEDLNAYIFKSKSPSSGMERIKIYKEDGNVLNANGVGLFAKAFMEKFPNLPVEDEGRLHDEKLRTNFLERVFILSEFRNIKTDKSLKALIEFHTRNKYLFMSHSQKHLKELGAILGSYKKGSQDEIVKKYFLSLVACLKIHTSTAKHLNVLMHMLGYFKEKLSGDEKQEFLDILDQYKKGLIPIIVPKTLIKHYVRKYKEPYLMEQSYLNLNKSLLL